MIDDFEEWFAIRNQHSDDDIWPGRLRFSIRDGVVLETISFDKRVFGYDAPCCESGTITGYLDYQRPTTLMGVWVQSRDPGTMGKETPLPRAKSRVVASAVVKNVHMTDPDEPCFLKIYADMPAFHFWYAPEMVKIDYQRPASNVAVRSHMSVATGEPIHENFKLNDGTELSIDSFVAHSREAGSKTIYQKTWLEIEFPRPEPLAEVSNRIFRIHTLFSFLIGQHMAHNPYRLRTTHLREWNGRKENITAELLFRPVYANDKRHVAWHDALLTQESASVSPRVLLNATVKQEAHLFGFMNIVLNLENRKQLTANDFTELLGCLEQFDIQENGKGRRTLKERLERLQSDWGAQGFRGNPSLTDIVELRNAAPHGRASTLSSNDFKKISVLMNYLCALSRFHILRKLGFSAHEVGAAFRHQAWRYGIFAPLSEDAPSPTSTE